MRFCLVILLALALAAGPLSVHAQDDPTPDVQTALDTVRAALDNFAQADTYSGQILQTIDQVITINYLGETVALTQAIKMEGVVTLQKAPQQRYADRQMDFVQSIAQTIAGSGLDDTTEIGPITFNIRVVNDRFYLRVQADDPLVAAQFPDGWRDITDGADAFPGMSLYDIDGLLAIGGNLGADFVAGMLDSVTSITPEPVTDAANDSLARYRLTLDPARTLDLIGMPSIVDMFDESRVPFDVPALIERLFNDEATAYTVLATVDASTNTLVEYVDDWRIDIEITPDLIIDPSLAGATMTLEQHSVQVLRPTAVNEPVIIAAPEIAE